LTPDGVGTHGPVPQPILDYCELHDLEIASYASLEAQFAAIADDIAYNTHDIDDGLRSDSVRRQKRTIVLDETFQAFP
ncbi:hypothetical protein ACC697_39795, partial [Rhizobium ruizarguesonis]